MHFLKDFREFEKVDIRTITKRAYKFDTSRPLERTIFARFPLAAGRYDLKLPAPRDKGTSIRLRQGLHQFINFFVRVVKMGRNSQAIAARGSYDISFPEMGIQVH
jgi:hypothetical protein